MLRLPAAFLFCFLLLTPEVAFAHGGNLRGPDGAATRPFSEPRKGTGQGRHRPDFTHDWDWWWDTNAGAYLRVRAKSAQDRAASRHGEPCFPESSPGDRTVVNRTKDRIRQLARPPLRLAMTDFYFDCRAASVIALGKVADAAWAAANPEVLIEMRKLLGDPDKGVRESACVGLGLLGDRSQAADLLLILEDDPRARALMGWGEKRILPRERAFAAVALGFLGMRGDLEEAVVAKVAARTEMDPDEGLRALSAISLGLMRNESSGSMLRRLATGVDVDAIVRAHAIVSLAKRGDRELMSWLVKDGLNERSPHVQRSSAIALGLLTRPEDAKTVETLILHAKASADRSVRNFSLIALGRIGGSKPVEFLLERLAKGQPRDRAFSALALGAFGAANPEPKARIAEALLRCFMEIRSDYDRGAFAIGLGLIGWKPAVPVLLEALKTRTFAQLDGHIATALGLLGASEAAPSIREIATSSEDSVSRGAARRALGLLGEDDDVQFLTEAIRQAGQDLGAIGGAAEGLGFRVDLLAVALAAETLSKRDDFKDTARAFTAVALGRLGDKDEVPCLDALRSSCNYLATNEALRELLRIY